MKYLSVLLLLRIIGCGAYDFYVQQTDDSGKDEASCFPASLSTCNLRSAVSACVNYANNCSIFLPSNEKLSLNYKTYGSIYLEGNKYLEVRIFGENSTLQCANCRDTELNTTFANARFLTYTGDSTTAYPMVHVLNLTLDMFGNSVTNGSAFYFSGSSHLELTGVTISNSIAYTNGAVYISNNATLIFQDVVAHSCEEGVLVLDEEVRDAKISYLKVTQSSGAMISLGSQNERIILSDITIENCNTCDAGIVMNKNNSYIDILGLSVTNCPCSALRINENNHDVTVNRITASNIQHKTIAIGQGSENVKLSNVEVVDCEAPTAGAAMSIVGARGVSIFNATVINCHSTLEGGGLVINGGTLIEVSNVTFKNVSSTTKGGAIAVETSQHVSMYDVTVEGGSARLGGGFYILSAINMTLEKVVVVNGSAISGGGGIYLTKSQSLNFTNVILLTCSSSKSGGGMEIDTVSNFEVNNLEVYYCKASLLYGGRGGGIYIVSGSENIDFTNTIVESCEAYDGGGMALYQSNKYINLIGSTISQNVAVLFGGGIYSHTGNNFFTVAGCKIDSNSATDGAGIYLGSSNQYFAVATKKQLEYRQVIESSHPYGSVTLQNWTVAEVVGHPDFYLFFDQQTNLQTTLDKLEIWSNGSLVFNSTVFNNWPGIDLPALQVSAPATIYLKWLGGEKTSTSDGFYGFKIYAFPIFKDISANSFSANMASRNGGGIFIGSSNSFGMITSATFTNNQASNGGGCDFFNANYGFLLSGLYYFFNFASLSGSSNAGGAIRFYSLNYGITISSSSFKDNVAGYGGAISLGLNNGNQNAGTFYNNESNYIAIYESTFTFNRAYFGGGVIVLDTSNVLVVVSSEMNDNTALTGGGGAIFTSGDNNVLNVTRCYFPGNRGQSTPGTGGALSIKNSRLILDSNKFNGNFGAYGGAIFTDNAAVVLAGVNILQRNTAQTGGGWCFLAAPLWTMNSTYGKPVWETVLQFTSNEGRFGSAIFFASLYASENSNVTIDNVVFEYNFVSGNGGGTVYWLSELGSGMSSLPDFYNTTWTGNANVYGEIVTQPIKLVGPRIYKYTEYNSLQQLVYKVYDAYGHLVPNVDYTYLTQIVGDEYNCSAMFPHISSSPVNYLSGQGLFEDLMTCYPGGFLSIITTFFMDISLTIISSQVYPTSYVFDIANQTDVAFRKCDLGEIITTSGACQLCPTGTYALYEHATSCTPCTGTGIDKCEGDKIILQEGFYRRHNSSQTVLQCPLDPSSCKGSTTTGSASCSIGYSQALCAVCDDGYFLANSQCLVCGGTNSLTSGVVLIVTIVGLCALVFVLYRFDSMTRGFILRVGEKAGAFLKERYRAIISKVKILVATYQIVSGVQDVCNVSMPRNFEKYVRIFSVFNLNFSTLFPIQCSWKFGYMAILVFATMLPIALSAIIWSCYLFNLIKLKSEARPHDSTQVKHQRIRKEHEAFYYYLNIFFYLSYLVLPGVSTTIFQTFNCTNIDPNNEDPGEESLFLTADMSVSCHSPYYKHWLIYAGLMIIVYPIGIPLSYFLVLYRHKDEIRFRDDISSGKRRGEIAQEIESIKKQLQSENAPLTENEENIVKEISKVLAEEDEAIDAQTIDKPGDEKSKENDEKKEKGELHPAVVGISFLWQAYEPKYWYWEVVECSRRIIMSGVLSVLAPGTSLQSVLSILFAVFYMTFYDVLQPYVADSDDLLASTGQIQIFLTFFVALILQNNLLATRWSNLMGALLMVCNLSVVAITAYFYAKEFRIFQAVSSRIGVITKEAEGEGDKDDEEANPQADAWDAAVNFAGVG